MIVMAQRMAPALQPLLLIAIRLAIHVHVDAWGELVAAFLEAIPLASLPGGRRRVANGPWYQPDLRPPATRPTPGPD
jgi:hypothetical protein